MPTSLLIANTEYKIDSDFRACLRIILAFEDNELTPQEKQIILLSILFAKLPNDIRQALEKANWFLNGGEVNNKENENEFRLCSFSKDAKFIFAAFHQEYSIDLEKIDMHWWQFLSLYMGLGEETKFCKIISTRYAVKTGTATKEQKQDYREYPEIYFLPDVDRRTLDEKEMEAEFLRKVEQAQRKK